MPELPEVETVVRSLQPLLAGRRITGIEMPEPGSNGAARNILGRLLGSPAGEFRSRLCGARVESFLTPKASFSASVGLTYRPPAKILRMAFTNSSGALSFVR